LISSLEDGDISDRPLSVSS